MSKNTKIFLTVLVLMVFIGGGLIYAVNKNKASVKNASLENNFGEVNGEVAGVTTDSDSSPDQKYLEDLARFMTDSGMVMYGAYWCPHCQDQKALFGQALKYIDYVECDSKGENANPSECQAKGIQSYPTWIFQGQKYSGYKSLADLAQIVGFSK